MGIARILSIAVLSAFLTAAMLVVAPVALAQMDPRALAKDSPANDPNRKQRRQLKETIQQNRYACSYVFTKSFWRNLMGNPSPAKGREQYLDLVRNQPEMFELLKSRAERYSPSAEHAPALVNADHEFEGICKRDGGLCYGFATLHRNFTILADYLPNQSVPYSRGSKAWFSLYRSIIDEIALKGRWQQIPGFANFREFSLVPEIELYMKQKTMELWARQSMQAPGLGVLLRAMKPMVRAEAHTIVNDLEARIARHEMPKIMFSSRVRFDPPVSIPRYLHVVLVYGVKRTPGGGARIQVWDVNFYGETMQSQPKELMVHADGSIEYPPWFQPGVSFEKISTQVARIEIAPENDAETVQHLQELWRRSGVVVKNASSY